MTVVRVVPSSVEGLVPAPGSKSYTHRFLLAAHLGTQVSRIRRPLESDDTIRTAHALRRLGSRVAIGKTTWTVTPGATPASRTPPVIDCGESGTTLRLLTAAAALRRGRSRFVGSGRLPHRPMEPLFDALGRLGATVHRRDRRLALPFTIEGPIHGGTVPLPVDESSQFTSALLFALPTVTPDSRIRTVGTPVSAPYVRASLAVLRTHQVHVAALRSGFQIPGGQEYRSRDLTVPGDASSAAYLWAAAGVTGGRATVDGVPADWPQADLAVLDLLRRHGCRVARVGGSVTVRGGKRRPFRVNLDDAPDLYPLAGVLAATCPGRSYLLGAAHVAAKESDRRRGTARLARALGGRVANVPNGLSIEGTDRPRSLHLDDLHDHRLLMSAVVGALAADRPSELADAGSVAKSFPGYFDALTRLGVEATVR